MEPETTMTFTEHLDELRKRLLYALIALLVSVAIAFIFRSELFAALLQPLITAWQEAGLGKPQIHFANPIEPFFTYIKVALLGGVMLGSPFVFYHLWQFVAPGL